MKDSVCLGLEQACVWRGWGGKCQGRAFIFLFILLSLAFLACFIKQIQAQNSKLWGKSAFWGAKHGVFQVRLSEESTPTFFYNLARQINLNTWVSSHLPANIYKAVRRWPCQYLSVLTFLTVDRSLICKLTICGWHSLLPEEEKIKSESTRQWDLKVSTVMLNYAWLEFIFFCKNLILLKSVFFRDFMNWMR